MPLRAVADHLCVARAHPPLVTCFSSASRTPAAAKGPQNRAPLIFSALRAETLTMSTPTPHLNGDRRLVFTSSQAAGYLGVSLATIRRWTDAGHISCYRTPGGQRRFSRDQLDHFIGTLHRDGPTVRSQIGRQHSARVA